jgi:hypothetical protein
MFDSVEKLPTWHKDAECQRHYDPNLWWYDYPLPSQPDERAETILRVSVALEYCSACPVRKECLAEGLKTDNLHAGSIWGGMLFSDRRRMLGKRANDRYYNERWLKAGLNRLSRRRNSGV